MKIAILRERGEAENRVAATPDTVKKYTALGARVSIESGAGAGASIPDEAYAQAGADITPSAEEAASGANLLLCVQKPGDAALRALPRGALVVGMLDPYQAKAHLPSYTEAGLTSFALELLPRISRAQAMDVLSSQSNLAGYRAVIEGVYHLGKAVPMMMTAAGTVAPAKALILGAGVAGLQAVATAKRLGAVVSAFDVRPAAKEQVESLGGKFIEVQATPEEAAALQGPYAKEMGEDYKKRQQQLIFDTIVKQDIVITTALIPGKPAPVLITEEMVRAMKPGAVIVDLAASAGGNCPLTEPGRVVEKHAVTLVGLTNLPGQVSADASALYARNLLNFVSTLLIKDGALAPQWEDELIKGTLLIRDGQAAHAMLAA